MNFNEIARELRGPEDFADMLEAIGEELIKRTDDKLGSRKQREFYKAVAAHAMSGEYMRLSELVIGTTAALLDARGKRPTRN